MKTFIKICGITTEENTLFLAQQNIDAIGFITYKKSPRYLSPEKTRDLIKLIPNHIKKVAVTVNESLETIQQYIDAGINVVQLHGDEDNQFAQSITVETWKALRLHSIEQLSDAKNFAVDMFVIDSFVKDSVIPGGTGKVADWQLAHEFINATDIPVLLAGGITAKNSQDALEQVKPFGLDLSSGVEVSPGIKDHDKIIELLATIEN